MPEPIITDAEFKNAGGRIEHWYHLDARRTTREVRTDPLSYRWMVDYYTLRRTMAHEEAMRTVETRMDVASERVIAKPTPVPVPGAFGAWSGDFLDARHNFMRPTFMLPGMPVQVQHEVLADYPGLEVPFGWKTFYPRFPQWTFVVSPTQYVTVLRRVLEAGKVPVVVFPIEGQDSLPAHLKRIEWYIVAIEEAGLQHLVRWQWGWEINDINDWTADGDVQIDYVKELRHRLPQANLWAHWTPDRWSCWPSFRNTVGLASDEGNELSGLQYLKKAGLTGVCYQMPPDTALRVGKASDGIGSLDRYLSLDQKNYQGPGILGRVLTAGLKCVCFEHSRTADRWEVVTKAVQADGRGHGSC